MTDDNEKMLPIVKSEQRLWNIIMAVSLGLGGWWLQNQYQTSMRANDQLVQFMQHVDEKYATTKRADLLQDRIDKLNEKLDRLIEHEIEDAQTKIRENGGTK